MGAGAERAAGAGAEFLEAQRVRAAQRVWLTGLFRGYAHAARRSEPLRIGPLSFFFPFSRSFFLIASTKRCAGKENPAALDRFHFLSLFSSTFDGNDFRRVGVAGSRLLLSSLLDLLAWPLCDVQSLLGQKKVRCIAYLLSFRYIRSSFLTDFTLSASGMN